MKSKGLRVAFVCPRFARDRTVGGAETLLSSQASYLAGLGWKVTFLATCAVDHFTWKNELDPGFYEDNGIQVGLFPVDSRDETTFHAVQSRICSGEKVTREEELEWIRNSVNSSSLCRYLSENSESFDVILMGPYLFGLVYFASMAAPEKTRLIPCLHDEPFARLQIVRELFSRVSGCIFNSQPEKSLATELFGSEVSTSACVGTGIQIFDADPAPFREKYKLSGAYVLYCGRRETLKGTPLLIDYFQTFRIRTGVDIKLVLTGKGPVDIPRSLESIIIDLGFVPEAEKRQAMAGATAFCHPSVNESLGIVLLESWVVRTPALVHAGSPALVYQCRKSKAGLWFRYYPEFEEELKLLYNDGNLNAALGARGRSYVEQEYSWEAVGKRLVDALS
jgi:glycosyltransferase involved in cell wall biosynthesis